MPFVVGWRDIGHRGDRSCHFDDHELLRRSHSALHKSAESVTQDDNATCNKLENPSLSDGSKLNLPPRKRTVPPFILSHDLPRGVIYMVQATLSYALMLAVMSVLSLLLFRCATADLFSDVGRLTPRTSSLLLQVWLLEKPCLEGGPLLPTIKAYHNFYYSGFVC